MPFNVGGLGSSLAAGTTAAPGIGTLIGGGLSLLGGLLGGSSGNPNDWAFREAQNYQNRGNSFLDLNNPFFQGITQQYYQNLTKSLNQSSPGLSQLIGLGVANGGSYGSSQNIANEKLKAIQARNRDTASSASSQFETGLAGQRINGFLNFYQMASGLQNLYGQGSMQNQQESNSFQNQLLGLGGGLLGRYFG